MAPTPVFLPGEPRGDKSPEGYSPWVTKSWTPLKRLSTRVCGECVLSPRKSERKGYLIKVT